MHIGIDLGTGSLKLMSAVNGGHEQTVSRPYAVLSPRPGYAETLPSVWLDALRDAFGEVGKNGEVLSIGFSGQMHGIVPMSRKRGALRPAILWADQRSRDMLCRFSSLPAPLRERLMNVPVAGLAAASILWLKEYEPDVYRETEYFLFPKDYIRWVLTGEIATDASDASGSLLYDFTEAGWCAEAAEALGVDPAKLPPIRSSLDPAGQVSRSAAELTGLPEGTPVAVGAGDTPAAMYGASLNSPASVQISVGTGAQIVRPCLELPPYTPSLNLFESAEPGVHYRMAAMLNAGLALEWVRERVGLSWKEVYAELEANPQRLPRDLLFLPYLTGERCPYMNSDARGAWIGLALHHREPEMLFSAMLGVACTVRLGLETLGVEGAEELRFLGGSAKYPFWPRLVASVLKRPLSVSLRTDSSVRGAAAFGASLVGCELDRSFSATVCEPFSLPWIDDYYERFRRLYAALYGESGAW